MSIYLDTSVLVALFTDDPFSGRADQLLGQSNDFLVGDYAAAEFASSIARHARMGELTVPEARMVFANFDSWMRGAVTAVETASSDIRAAEGFLRRLDLTLRAGDALHIAVAQRNGADLATFDVKMSASAGLLGVSLASV